MCSALNQELSELPIFDPVSFAGIFNRSARVTAIGGDCCDSSNLIIVRQDMLPKCRLLLRNARGVVLPHTVTCCGTAGDREFLSELPRKP